MKKFFQWLFKFLRWFFGYDSSLHTLEIDQLYEQLKSNTDTMTSAADTLDAVNKKLYETQVQLDNCMRALGQMNHDKNVPGIMTMNVEIRSKLISEGYAVLPKKKWRDD